MIALCQKHKNPAIWGRKGKNIERYCTQCMDEEWEKEFGKIREEWKHKSRIEILVELGVFCDWLISRGYSKTTAKLTNKHIKYLLKNICHSELSEENVKKLFEKRSKKAMRYHLSALRRFLEFKKEREV